MFESRIDAGKQLANALVKYKDEDTVVLAIPRGGLPLGNIIAKALEAPLDVVLTKKIGHPYSREYAIGAVGLDDMIINDAIGVTKSYIDHETIRIRDELKRRKEYYYQHKTPENLKDKVVLIVDDGVATGNTILITVELVKKRNPKKIVVAVPVASESAIEKLKTSPHIAEVICLSTPSNFQAVGQFYEAFEQVSDDEAIQLLEDNYANRSQSLKNLKK